MQAHVIESDFSDNYFYVVHDGERALLVDPVDAPSAIAALESLGVELEWVVNTHFHHDHIAGDDEVLARFPGARLAVAAGDAETIAGSIEANIDRRLEAGDVVEIGGKAVKVWETPGHTPGHISLTVDDHLFCGDTIFIGGAGNCSFGGDPGVLFRTFRDVLATLDDALLVFPGHDYSVRNLEFCLDVEPDNALASELLEKSRASDGLFQTTLGTERQYNPFMRWNDDALVARLKADRADVWSEQRALSEDDSEAAFRTVRALRNNW
jgi:hydroxyacylglutathione hydrolase